MTTRRFRLLIFETFMLGIAATNIMIVMAAAFRIWDMRLIAACLCLIGAFIIHLWADMQGHGMAGKIDRALDALSRLDELSNRKAIIVDKAAHDQETSSDLDAL